jgi:hypothetical protein
MSICCACCALLYTVISVISCDHGLINYTDAKAKCRHLKKLNWKGTLRQVFICLRPPPLLGFCLGWSSNFVCSQSGQIQSVTILQNPVPSPLHTAYVYTVHGILIHTRKGGGGSWTREKVRGATVHKAGSKIPTWLTVSPVYKLW